jgi:predicted RNase H-like HicB family nuclease
MQSYLVIIKPHTVSGGTIYGAFTPDIPGCTVTGRTLEQALDLVRSSLRSALRTMIASGQQPPLPTDIGVWEKEYLTQIDTIEQEQILLAFAPCTAFPSLNQ